MHNGLLISNGLKRVFVVVCMSLLAANVFAAELDMQKANTLMTAGKPAEAYSYLEPFEPEKAGDIDFDYLFGIAALDSGKANRAVIAFERVLAVNPAHLGARLDMGRAFFALGSLDLAKQEFERVLAAKPPAAARNVVEQYLTAIDQHFAQQKRSLTGYVEAGAGFDNNVTSVTSSFQGGSQQAFPGTGALNPTGASIKRDAGFFTLGGGVDYTAALTEILTFSAGLDYKRRSYNPESPPVEPVPRPVAGDVPADNSAFDSDTLGFRVGLGLQLEKNFYGVNLQRQVFKQRGDIPINPGDVRITADRDTDSAGVEWRHALTPEIQLGVFTQYAENRFSVNRSQDTNQTLLGLSYLHAFKRPGKPVLFVSVYQAEDSALRVQNPPPGLNDTDVSKTVTGLRVYGQYSVRESTDLFAGLGYSRRVDDTPFSRSRGAGVPPIGEDDTVDVTLGVNWRFAPLWLLRGQVQNTKNDSNLTLYSFKRTETLVTLRRDFR